MNKTSKWFNSIAALALAALACGVNLGGPEAPEATAPVSIEAAQSLVEAWEQAFDSGKASGTVELTLTEAQLTSFLAAWVANQENPALTNPQVDLRDGEMEVLGTYESGAISANVRILMEVSVDEKGAPVIEVTSGSLGPLPVPAELLQGVSKAINQALTGEIGAAATGFTLESIILSEGSVSINGTLK